MKQPFVNSTADPEIRVRFQTQLAEARETPLLSRLVRRPTADLYPRYSGYYRQLCRLPRRVRRQLQRQWRRSLSAIALLLALGQAPALAANITVAPGVPPAINADGLCALIEAIDNANDDGQTHADCVAGSGADTIVLPLGSTQSLTAVDTNTFRTGLPAITSALTIRGRNSTIRRESNAPDFRILYVTPTGDLTLHSTTVSGGRTYYGGGVSNSGILTLTNSTVSGNDSYYGGGGVDNTGTLTLTNSTVSGNSGGGGRADGGGISNSGTLTLTNSTVSGNSVGNNGGGVFNSGTATLTNSRVSGNSTLGYGGAGGGVYNRGTLTLTNSTVSGNDGRYGGGVLNSGTATLTNSTVSGNSIGGYGGGGGALNSGTLTLTNSTVSGNFGAYGSGGVYNTGTLTLIRALISGNSLAPYSYSAEVVTTGSQATIIANNHNLFGHDGDAGVGGFSPGPTDLVPNAPLSAILKPLADNGGPTKTHALPAGSPAIGQSPANRGCRPTDQRGVTRPQGAACDIGAFEKGPPVRCGGRLARILGTVGNDSLLSGTPGPDVIHGLAGNDIIDGLEGNDIICGGTGGDELFGSSGTDKLFGGSGTDTCTGGSGADTGTSCETEISIP